MVPTRLSGVIWGDDVPVVDPSRLPQPPPETEETEETEDSGPVDDTDGERPGVTRARRSPPNDRWSLRNRSSRQALPPTPGPQRGGPGRTVPSRRPGR